MWEFPKAQCKNNNTHAVLPVFENIQQYHPIHSIYIQHRLHCLSETIIIGETLDIGFYCVHLFVLVKKNDFEQSNSSTVAFASKIVLSSIDL